MPTVTVVAKIFSRLLQRARIFRWDFPSCLWQCCGPRHALTLCGEHTGLCSQCSEGCLNFLERVGDSRSSPGGRMRQLCSETHKSMKPLLANTPASSGRENQQATCFMRPQLSLHCLFGLLVQCWSPGSKEWYCPSWHAAFLYLPSGAGSSRKWGLPSLQHLCSLGLQQEWQRQRGTDTLIHTHTLLFPLSDIHAHAHFPVYTLTHAIPSYILHTHLHIHTHTRTYITYTYNTHTHSHTLTRTFSQTYTTHIFIHICYLYTLIHAHSYTAHATHIHDVHTHTRHAPHGIYLVNEHSEIWEDIRKTAY